MTFTNGNMAMIRGDSELFNVSLTEDGITRALVDGDTVYFTVKTSTATETITLQKIITKFTDGKALVEIEPSDTAELETRGYVYDIQITFADGTVKTVISPKRFSVGEEVTYE